MNKWMNKQQYVIFSRSFVVEHIETHLLVRLEDYLFFIPHFIIAF